MIDGNISMEEDTELRDLVVQTLENNGVLAKVRAELRASLFLTLEEQESVLNPEPCLNHSVKQYLARPEGKILFSLVREFLEYFGLNYTMSVYDPETYLGKDYKYEGRKKLSQELGIESKEPLIGEILKNTINSALNSSKSNNKMDHSETSINPNTTFDVSVPKVLQQRDSLSNEETKSESTADLRFNDKDLHKKTLEDINTNKVPLENTINQNNETDAFSSASHDKLITTDLHNNKDQFKNKNNEFQTRNSMRNEGKTVNNLQRTVYFDKVVVDGVAEKVADKDEKSLLGELPLINNCSLSDLPPLEGKKANMSDLKELMEIAQSVSQYQDDFTPPTSVEIEEESLSSPQIKSDEPQKLTDRERSKSESKEIEQT